MDKQKAFKLPDAKLRGREPVFIFGTPNGLPYAPELRDTSKPLFYDEAGNAVYGPRGFVFRLR